MKKGKAHFTLEQERNRHIYKKELGAASFNKMYNKETTSKYQCLISLRIESFDMIIKWEFTPNVFYHKCLFLP